MDVVTGFSSPFWEIDMLFSCLIKPDVMLFPIYWVCCSRLKHQSELGVCFEVKGLIYTLHEHTAYKEEHLRFICVIIQVERMH